MLFCFLLGTWSRDGAGSKTPLWMVISFLTQGSGPRPLCPFMFLCSLLCILAPAKLFSLSWSVKHTLYCFSFAFTYIILLSSQKVLPFPRFFLSNLSSSLWSVPSHLWSNSGSTCYLQQSLHFTLCLCLLKQETAWYLIRSTGHWLESLLTVGPKLQFPHLKNGVKRELVYLKGLSRF